jgi:hypothetical protein
MELGQAHGVAPIGRVPGMFSSLEVKVLHPT